MLSCRNGVLYRTLTLLGLVLAFAVIAVGGWAQERAPLVYKEVVDGAVVTFPYLSPVADQRNLLVNAFLAQKKIFYAMSGGDDSIEALKYLALVAAMLGAILIVFNAKYRKGPILFAWFIVLILCLFSPYGSRLLFYPVSSNSVIDRATGTTVALGGNCDSKDQICGFTPQLAGLHIAATLQLLFSDVFVSLGWTSLLDDVAARTSLERNPLLIASPEWLTKVDGLRNSCSGDLANGWGGVIESRIASSGADDSNDANIGVPTFGEVFGNVKTYFQNARDSSDNPNRMYPPPGIVFYDENTPGFKDWLENQTPENTYANGLTFLVKNFAKIDKSVMLEGSSGFEEGKHLTFAQALDALKTAGLFEVGYSSALNPIDQSSGVFPGFFFIHDNQQEAADFRLCYRNFHPETRRILSDADCLDPPNFRFDNNILANRDYRQNYINSVFDEQFSYQAPGTRILGLRLWNFSYNKWPELMPLLKNDAVSKMPVGIMNFKMGKPPQASDTATTPYVIQCTRDANEVMDETFDWNLGQYGRAPEFKLLRDLLVDKKEFDSDRLSSSLIVDPIVFASESEQQSYCSDGVLSTNSSCMTRLKNSRDLYAGLERAYAGEIDRYKLVNGTNTVSSSDRYKVLAMLVIGSIEASTRNQLSTSNAEARATVASQSIDNKENSEFLTDVGSGVASFIGNIFIKVGSFFVGPLSATIIYFLSIFVDLALMALIILTPVLFLAALVMPASAIGVLTIVVMGAFILKFVPVTLIIINALSRLVYVTIGGAQSANSEQMKELITLAGAGLYANLIGLTFFLLFKLGDASAVLSRFAALDSSASKVAEAGWNATKAAAALAALPIFGAVGGAVGSRFGAAIASRAGVAPELTNLVRGAQTMAEDKLKGGNSADPLAEQRQAGIENAMKPIEEGGLGLSEQEANDLFTNKTVTDQHGRQFRLGDNGPVWEGGGEGVDFVSAHGVGFEKGEDGTLKAVDAGAQGLGHAMVAEQRGKQQIKDREAAKASALLPNMTPSAEEQKYISDMDSNYQGLGKERVAPNAAASSGGATNTETGDAASGAGATNGVANAAGASPNAVGQNTAGGIAANVNVVSGKLDSVGTVSSVGEAKAPETKAEKIASRVAERDVEAAADQALAVREAKKSFSQSDTASAEAKQKAAVIDETDPDAMSKLRKIAKDDNFNLGAATAQGMKSHNLNQQYAKAIDDMERTYAGQFASIADKEKNGGKLTPFEKYLKDTHKKMIEQDPAGLVLGEQTKALANVERLQASLGARYGADNAPGFLKSMASGFYGGIAGSGGGLAKIPVVGTAISEALNEFHQAPERARAWNSAGGFGSWWTAQGNAKRMSFYQKEMAPLAAGHQYEQMAMVGGFQAQADIARQAASEAVAKSRTQWEGMMAERKGAYMASNPAEMATIRKEIENKITLDSVKLQNPNLNDKAIEQLRDSQVELKFNEQVLANAFNKSPVAMSAVELAGLGRHEVAARIGSLRSEANVAQTASLMVKTLKSDLDENMMMKSTKLSDFKERETNVFLTPDMLANTYGNIGVKGAGKRNDEMMVVNYGLVEKQFLRGEGKWDATRNMAFNREAAGQFARVDVDTDYLVGGHLNMVQGKERFFESRGQYQSLVKYRHESNIMVADYLKQQLQQVNSGIHDAIKGLGASSNAASWSAADRSKLEKWARNELKDKGVSVPLEAIFDVSFTNGKAKYEQKAMTAMYEVASQNAENWAKTQKSAASALAAGLPDIRNLSKKISFEKDGVKFDIGSATDKLFEKFDMALSSRATEAIQVFTQYFSQNDRQKNAFNIKMNGDKENPEGWMRVDKNEFEGYLNALDKQSPGLGDKIRAKFNDGKTFRTRGDFVEWGFIDHKGNDF